MTEENFDQLLKEMREENVPSEQRSGARERVWQRLTDMGSLACAEFQPDFAAYLEGGLLESRRLLIEDHLGRCPGCRQAVAKERRRWRSNTRRRSGGQGAGGRDAATPRLTIVRLDAVGRRRRCRLGSAVSRA